MFASLTVSSQAIEVAIKIFEMDLIPVVIILLASLSAVHSQTVFTMPITDPFPVGILPSEGTQPYPNSDPTPESAVIRHPYLSYNVIKPDTKYPFLSPFQTPYQEMSQPENSIRYMRDITKSQNSYGGGGGNGPDPQFGNWGRGDGMNAAFMRIRGRMLGLQRDVEQLSRDIARINRNYDFN